MSASLPAGSMSVRILDDGTVRVETGDMAGITHQAADAFLKEITALLGGEVTMLKAEQPHHHHHHEGDVHAHGDHHHSH